MIGRDIPIRDADLLAADPFRQALPGLPDRKRAGKPSLLILEAIAGALGVAVSDLLEEPAQ